MNKNDLYRAIGEIDDKYIIEAEKSLQTGEIDVQEASREAFGPARHRTRLKDTSGRRGWGRWAVIAACALLAVGVALPLATGGLRMGSSAPKQAMNGYSGGASMQTAKADANAAEEAESKDAFLSPEQMDSIQSGETAGSDGGAAATAGGSTPGVNYENSSSSGSQESPSGSASTEVKNLSGDFPAMIMLGGTLYRSTGEYADAAQIGESDILGYTTSYTDEVPDEDGETNFLRENGAPCASWQDGIAVRLPDGRWLCFAPKE